MCTPILNLTKDEHVWTIYDTLPPPPSFNFSPSFSTLYDIPIQTRKSTNLSFVLNVHSAKNKWCQKAS